MNKFDSYMVDYIGDTIDLVYSNFGRFACTVLYDGRGSRNYIPCMPKHFKHECEGEDLFDKAKIRLPIMRYTAPRADVIAIGDTLVPSFTIMHVACQMGEDSAESSLVYEPRADFETAHRVAQPQLFIPKSKLMPNQDGLTEFEVLIHNKTDKPVVIPGGTHLGTVSEALTANGVYSVPPLERVTHIDCQIVVTDLAEVTAQYEERIPLPWLGDQCPLIDVIEDDGYEPIPELVEFEMEAEIDIGPVMVGATAVEHKPDLAELLAQYPKEVRGPGLIDLIERGLQPVEEELTVSEQRKLVALLCQFIDIYARSDTDLGFTDIIQHRIPLKPNDSEPFFQKSRRFPINIREKLIEQIQEQEKAGLLRPSTSCWSSPIVPIMKTDKSLRICINYQGLNAKTVQNKYPLPQISEIFDALGRAKYFSKMDFVSGFYQIGMHPADVAKTAFTVPGLGLYEWLVLPMGLTGSPATFQALLDIVLAGLKFKCAFAYIDDIIVFSTTLAEHFEHLRQVFVRVRKAKLKLKLKKCKFGCKQIDFLGHVISSDGIATDALKVDKVKNARAPGTVKEVQSFLGLAGYYRQFVKGYSKIARPLTLLLHEDVSFEWGEDQQAAFDTLKTALISSPVLAYPDMDKAFILATDASRLGFGAVLSQYHGKKERPNAYASRCLQAAELNYGITELEMAAACWAILKFKHYLYGQPFVLVTDHQPLKWVFEAKEQATNRLDRLKLKVGVYITQMEVMYKRGETHTNADAMSRFFLTGVYPEPEDTAPERRDDDEVELHHDILAVSTRRRGVESLPDRVNSEGELTQEASLNAGLPGQPLASTPKKKANWEVEPSAVGKVQKKAVEAMHLVHAGFDKEVLEKILAEQKKDWEVWTHCRFHQCEELNGEESNFVYLAKGFEQCFISNEGVLMWSHPEIKRSEGVVVLPRQLRDKVFKEFHDAAWTGSHQGFPRTFEKIASRYYWPGYRQEIKKKCESCRHCAQRKNPRKYTRAELTNIPLCTEPWQRICSDVMGPLPLTERGNKYIVTFTDYFTRWTEAVALPDQTAQTIARAMVDAVVCRYGAPKVILTDKGSNYLSMTFSVVCQLLGIEQVRSAAYHPQTDGVSERFNRTLQDSLSHYVAERGTDWDLWLQPCMHALRLSVHRAIGDCPYFVLFGRDCKVAMDHELNLPNQLYIDPDDYKLNLIFALHDCWTSVRKAQEATQTRSKFDYDKSLCKGTADQWIIGQLVDLWRPKKPHVAKKFWKPWRGPYRLCRVEWPNVWLYRLDDPQQRVFGPEHVNNLKHYKNHYLPPLL
ncbi:MAG: DDE-type integrase/transposase/recombinase, partial [Gammaproteobacteria bacterium]|nr:DDE-type integrase/transposase/recombinase [Gammaproteobacteria bacterium]